MAIYISSSKNHSHCACHAQPTPSAWNHEHDRVSDFVPIASLLEWQWRRIVMRNAGSAQMQTQSYRARQSRNLARKVRNAFPRSTALINN